MFSDETTRIGVKKIADELEIPHPFLAKLLQKLNKSNIVSSSKGPKGGFYLGKTNSNKTVWDIIICIDTTRRFDQCFLGLSKCDDKNPCPVHFTASPFKKKIRSDFKDKSIVQFANEIKSSNKVISLKGINLH
jgi:Rrf2 family protein